MGKLVALDMGLNLIKVVSVEYKIPKPNDCKKIIYGSQI
jgi:hypothetical protein